jgi:predicted solute-binding protein
MQHHRSPFTSPASSRPSIQTGISQVPSPSTAPQVSQTAQKDELTRIFNTALVSTQTGKKRDFSSELYELVESPAFKAILSAVRQLSRIHGVSERQAAEQVIQTFRKVDEVWGEYVFREGLDRIRGQKR